jgi:Na+-transporting methylmalonyl-CoA/oxaloacetate decarboxylase gamma subunit
MGNLLRNFPVIMEVTMRLRFILLAILAFMIAACSSTNENSNDGPNSISEAQETLAPVVTEVQETIEPVITEAATIVATVMTPAPSECESLPELTTEGEDGVTVPENAVAVFQKTGGFAGISETTVIYEDGHIENDKNEELQVPPQVVDGVIETAADAGFFDLNRNYVPEDHCCDFFTYSVTIRDCERVHTVITADEVPGAPAELNNLISTIESIITNMGVAVPPATS